MKKQTIYLLCGSRKNMTIETAQGYIVDLVDDYGNITKIGLHYKRPFWYATHYETGLGCTPWQHDSGGMRCKHWKSKEMLLAELKKFDFHGMCKRNPFIEEYRTMIAAYKEDHK